MPPGACGCRVCCTLLEGKAPNLGVPLPYTCPVVHIQELVLKRTHVPLSALLALTDLQQLSKVYLDLSHMDHISGEDLHAILSMLCLEIRTLKDISIQVAYGALDDDEDEGTWDLHEQLEAWGIGGLKPLRIITYIE